MRFVSAKFEDLLGKMLTRVEVSDDKEVIRFIASDGTIFEAYHQQDCCETVRVEDIAGDLSDLVGAPILLAEEVESTTPPAGLVREFAPESETWTFYKLATIKGSVTIRWLGESNGWYSESVDFRRRIP